MVDAEVIVDDDGVWMVRGEMTFATAPALRERANRLFDDGTGEIGIDLAAVARVDSAGLALLIDWMRAAAAHGRTVCYRNLPGQMLDIARVSGLAGILPRETA